MTHGMVWYDHSSTVVICISWNYAGTKNVSKEMRIICTGTVGTETRRGSVNSPTRVCVWSYGNIN